MRASFAQEEEARENARTNCRGRGGGRYCGRGRNNNNRKPMQNRQVGLVGGEGVDNDQPFRPSSGHRNYKIQEVIKRGQIMLIQVQKKSVATKAAVITYLSLA